jgi:hypothetical protein
MDGYGDMVPVVQAMLGIRALAVVMRAVAVTPAIARTRMVEVTSVAVEIMAVEVMAVEGTVVGGTVDIEGNG